jgi:hypothetical protein
MCSKYTLENVADEKATKEIFDHFEKFFTMEQVKQTLIANYNDKGKSLNDLKYKQGTYCKRLTLCRLAEKEEQRQHQSCNLREDLEGRGGEEEAVIRARGIEDD